MPMTSITLRPGVNTQLTLASNEAGVSVSQLIRYDGGMIETYGGWTPFQGIASLSTVRDLHPFKGLTDTKYLGIGATQSLSVYNSDTNLVIDITPQTHLSNPPPNFSISSGSVVVTVVDGNSSASIYNTVFFNTPVAIGNLLLNGAYDIVTVLGSSVYTINSSIAASTTITSSGILPIFNTSSGSAIVRVTLPNNNFQMVAGLFYDFIAPTTVGGLTIEGPYEISSIIDSTDFTINATEQSSATATATMNSSLAQLLYYITLGPQPVGGGFGSGGFGDSGFGSGSATSGGTGTPITAEDWTMDNWGGVLLACPKDGPIYTWSENSGYTNAQVISEAPFFNGGIYVSMPQQILVAWKSCQSTGVQAPLIVRWSDAGDYTNWEVSNQTAAGSFTFPNGSEIRGGLQSGTQGIIWTDVDVWVQQYIGGDLVFSHNRVGSGCGLVGPHAAGTLAGVVYWMGPNNFYSLSERGVNSLPCPVWDFVFQNTQVFEPTVITKVRCAINSMFNEVMWFFPSAEAITAASPNPPENDSYVKYNVTEGQWDYGTLSRTAWCDASILGNPIATDPFGVFYEHEDGESTTGVSFPNFQSGWWSIAEGNEMAFVDYVIPDFIWGRWALAKSAQVAVTFFSANYPGEQVTTHGPYVVTQSTQYITPRIRGRLMSVSIQSENEKFWRIGRVRYRFAPSGRR